MDELSRNNGLNRGSVDELSRNNGLNRGWVDELSRNNGLNRGAVDELSRNNGLNGGAVEEFPPENSLTKRSLRPLARVGMDYKYITLSLPMLKSKSTMLRSGRKPCLRSKT